MQAAGSEDDGDFTDMVEGLTMNDIIHPSPGGSFSALTPSMWPQDILARLTQPEVSINNAILNGKFNQIIVIVFFAFPVGVRPEQSAGLSI